VRLYLDVLSKGTATAPRLSRTMQPCWDPGESPSFLKITPCSYLHVCMFPLINSFIHQNGGVNQQILCCEFLSNPCQRTPTLTLNDGNHHGNDQNM
jgi:hypothetical protein